MKKCLIYLCVVAILAGLLAGCGSTPQQTSDSMQKTSESTQEHKASEPAKKVSIKWLFWYPEPVEFIKKFNDSQDRIIVEYENIAGTEYPSVLNTRIAANEVPDIYTAYYTSTYYSQAEKGELVDLTNESFWQYYDSEAIEQSKAKDGKLYALPTTATLNFVYYNKDILDKYNLTVPQTYDEYLNVCEVLKKNGVIPQVQGMKEGWQCKFAGYSVMSAILYEDQDWLNKLDAGQVKWTDANMLKHWKNKMDFMQKGYIHPDSLSLTFQQAWQLWCTQQAAFISGGTFYINNGFMIMRPDFNWVVGPVPIFEKGQEVKIEYTADGSLTLVNTKGKNVEQSLEFIRWFADPENMTEWSKSNMAPVCLKDADFKAVDPQEGDKYTEINKLPKYHFMREPQYVSSEYPKVQQDMMLGNKTPEQAVQELQDKTDISIKK